MGKPAQFTATLDPVIKEYLEIKVAQGNFESISEAINTAVRAMMTYEYSKSALVTWDTIVQDMQKKQGRKRIKYVKKVI